MGLERSLRRIGLVGFDGSNALDLVGPIEAFSTVNGLDPATRRYEVMLLAINGQPIRTESGLVLTPGADLDRAPDVDTILIPGGVTLRSNPALRDRLASWIASRASTTRRLVSVCTGFYALAASGALDGRRATTHWRHASDAARLFPRVRIDPDAIFVRDGPCWTSAGVTAGIDLALALIEDDAGAPLALGAARELVVYLKRSGGQLQYSEPLRFQVRARGRFADLVDWLPSHLSEDLSVDVLAKRVNYSVRNFARAFRMNFGVTPAEYVERLRLEHAAERLAMSVLPIATIAHSLGYRRSDTFRRAFERHFGLGPSDYRARFAHANSR